LKSKSRLKKFIAVTLYALVFFAMLSAAAYAEEQEAVSYIH